MPFHILYLYAILSLLKNNNASPVTKQKNKNSNRKEKCWARKIPRATGNRSLREGMSRSGKPDPCIAKYNTTSEF